MGRSGVSEVVGIVLAAGRSTRMGQPKALLPCPPDGRTFVTQIVHTLREGGLVTVAVVGRGNDHDLRREVAAATPAVSYVENPSPELGQLSSLLAGIAFAEARGAAGVLVVPVDMPLIRPDTVRTALDAFGATPASVLRATHQGRHGHPVIFRADVFQALRSADLDVGARAVLHQDPSRVRNLEVDDPGVLRDFDWPAEYRGLVDPSTT
jgi:molybdenum cofactor cytidylyltransferase